MKFKMKLMAASVALIVGAGQAQAAEQGFVAEHPWVTTAGGVALMGATSGVPQIFGLIFTLGGLSHAFKPEIESATHTLRNRRLAAAPKESDTPLCTGEIGVINDSFLAMEITGLPKQKRAEAIAMELKIGCITISTDAGRAGRFSSSWDDAQEVMHAACNYGDGFPRKHTISFTGDFAQWRTEGANCAHLVGHEKEAELQKKFGPSSLD